jgi:hypothetical protein
MAEISIHESLLPECKIMFKQLEDKIDNLIVGVEKRDKEHATNGRWIIGLMATIILTIVIQIGVFLFMWGQLTKQVEINSGRIYSIEELHPRTTK